MSSTLKSDRPTAIRTDDGYYSAFATGTTRHGVRIIDCDALARARKAGATWNAETRTWSPLHREGRGT